MSRKAFGNHDDLGLNDTVSDTALLISAGLHPVSPVQMSDGVASLGQDPQGVPTTHKTVTEQGAYIVRGDANYWGTSEGQPATITFGFRTSAPSYTVSGRDVQGTFSAFTSQEQAAARAALALWSSLSGITFTDLGNSNSATIEFGNYNSSTDSSEAFAFLPGATGDQSSGSSQGDVFMNTYYASTTNLGAGTYEWMTLIHEIGHALGLQHPGAYNAGSGTPTYNNSAEYIEDTRMYSIMSYWSEAYTGGSFTSYDETPMIADIVAIQRLYGANNATRNGNTTYGFNSNIGQVTSGVNSPYSITSASQHVTFAIWDGGGTDTLDLSGYTQGGTIDLRPEHFSSVGGDTFNISIGTGVNIENAIGGSGNELFITNPSLLSTLTGGGGNDTFSFTRFGWVGSAITDMNVGDRFDFTDVAYSTASYTRSGTGTTFTISDNGSTGTGTLTNNAIGHLVLSSDGATGTYATMANHNVYLNDFNGDGHSDFLWRQTTGMFTVWDVSGNTLGNNAASNVYVNNSVDNNWRMEGTLDFAGNGSSDLLFRNISDGTFSIWNANGQSFTQNAFVGGVETSWSISALGDFNGDGRSDLLFRNVNGGFTEWQSTGTTFNTNVYVNFSVDNTWHVAGVGDFNGDGKDDLIWRNNSGQFSEWQSNGNAFNLNVYVNNSVDTTWHIAGFGDFNGDGRSDILFRNNSGQLSEWQSTGNGFTPNVFVTSNASSAFQIAGIGDFNDDGRDDILFKNDAGNFSTWQSTGNSFIFNVLNGNVGASWSLVTHHYDTV